MSYISDVALFHEKFELRTPTSFVLLPPDLHQFRLKFLQEELDEYIDSCKSGDLGTAFDSLIDLVYVACGTALLHGYTPEKFDKVVLDFIMNCRDDEVYLGVGEPHHAKPTFLTPAQNVKFTKLLQTAVDAYGTRHDIEQDVHFAIDSIVTIYCNCISGSIAMGLSYIAWQEMWADVQRANMAKERVLRAEDSKRGSTWDVRKPEGWVPPRTQEILEKYL